MEASSRGLALERGVNNVGPIAASAVKALQARGLRAVPELGREASGPSISWRHAPFKEFRLVQGEEGPGNVRVWTITELLTSRALSLEGQAMRHCVATYKEDCVRRQTSIWSMQAETQRGRQRALTIEVDIPRRTVCQVQGKCNRLPSANERAVVGRWAAQEGLRVAEAVRA